MGGVHRIFSRSFISSTSSLDGMLTRGDDSDTDDDVDTELISLSSHFDPRCHTIAAARAGSTDASRLMPEL